mmetsp:Transcript_5318/g.7306  ORF Transcript_5318/g.7306 Transcript_5318/m.7306 type:complete len:84 (+) Transcript_5318:51-302(+)|eukprot:CAMPEP_0185724740 /NCGR_PEP_ID=MMETSP1171-20130828/1131_1 /TAXON_ID=374046 /ORGANISM="Helicotheca tamensis, Strain CCMP826" /LENGTH=83 /DNA_ID=CAMNT_0028392663 /DNA_START=51 /DNA_END=302 /DNA_ORIENTATION=-
MSAIFDFSSLLTVLLLLICTCAYIRDMRPAIFDGGAVQEPGKRVMKRPGIPGVLWKLSRIGERLSPYVGASCAIMAVHLLFFK